MLDSELWNITNGHDLCAYLAQISVQGKKTPSENDVRKILFVIYRKEDFLMTTLYAKLLEYQRENNVRFVSGWFIDEVKELYNKNIILNILVNTFGKDIETYVQDCIDKMEIEEIEEYFDQDIDYAVLAMINQMLVEDYEVEGGEGNQQIISGTLEVKAEIDGWSKWEEIEVFKESAEIPIGLLYEFQVKDKKFSDLYLEYLY